MPRFWKSLKPSRRTAVSASSTTKASRRKRPRMCRMIGPPCSLPPKPRARGTSGRSRSIARWWVWIGGMPAPTPSGNTPASPRRSNGSPPSVASWRNPPSSNLPAGFPSLRKPPIARQRGSSAWLARFPNGPGGPRPIPPTRSANACGSSSVALTSSPAAMP